jgi:hypothetical protein
MTVSFFCVFRSAYTNTYTYIICMKMRETRIFKQKSDCMRLYTIINAFNVLTYVFFLCRISTKYGLDSARGK